MCVCVCLTQKKCIVNTINHPDVSVTGKILSKSNYSNVNMVVYTQYTSVKSSFVFIKFLSKNKIKN